MTRMRTAILIAIGLIMAIFWGTRPPRYEPAPGRPVGEQKQMQCPPGAVLDGKVCVCPAGTVLKDETCKAL